VTVVNWKLEQSTMREVISGIFPVRVPVTPLAQLSAEHKEVTEWAMAKARMMYESFLIAISENVGRCTGEAETAFKLAYK
jgi:hypothetical protein